MAPKIPSLPSGADEIWWFLAQKLTEHLPQQLRAKFGELTLRVVFYEGRPVKADGEFKCSVRENNNNGETGK